MGSENHIFCSLCLCRIWDKNAEEIKDCTREILDLIFVNRNLPLSIGQKFCQICSTKIQDAFNFKCMCVGTTKGSLKDAYTSKNGYGELLDMLSGQKMCRLCLQLADGSFTSLLNEREREVIREYIPEMTLENTWDPVACETCIRSLYNYVAFINQCIHAQEKRNRSSLSEIACFNGRDYALTENNEKFKKQSEIETQEDKQVIITKCMNRPQVSSFMDLFKAVPSYDPFQFPTVANNRNVEHNSPLSHHKNRVLPTVEEVSKVPSYDPFQFPNVECNRNVDLHSPVSHCQKTGDPAPIETEDSSGSSILYDLDLHMLKGKELSDCDISEELYKCKECDYKSKYRSALKTHFRNHHDASKQTLHICEYCGYHTKYPNALKSHKLNHMNPLEVKLYSCEKCEYKTKYRNALKSHKLNHKSPSEIEMRKCDVCSYETKHRTALVLHMLKHKNPADIVMYKCDKCEFQTKFKHALKPHKLKHKGNVSE